MIHNHSTLAEIVRCIGNLNFTRTSLDVKGGAYERFLSSCRDGRKKSALGQFFTPRHITNMIAKIMDFKIGSRIYDPFCGTGGMLISCYRILENKLPSGTRRHESLDNLNTKTLFGRDIAQNAAQLAKMNMVILGDGHSNIEHIDSLRNPVYQKYDAVVTNIPFGLKLSDGNLNEHYDSVSNDPNDLCIHHCLRALRKGGRAAIILPETVAYAPKHQVIRNFIKVNSTIRAVIRLPRATFSKYTTARTCVLILEDIWKGKTKKFPLVDIKNDGFSKSTLREPIKHNDIKILTENYLNISANYPSISARGDDYVWFHDESEIVIDEDKSWALGDLLDVTDTKTKLQPDVEYVEPRLNSSDNTVTSSGHPRLGRNIKTDGKVIANRGDLIISTLHTQSGNGLFAISNADYICTSQIVAKIKDKIVNKEYLCFMLTKVLPTLKSNDLVGRETYKREDILALRIPKHAFFPDATRKKIKKIVSLREKRTAIENELFESEKKVTLVGKDEQQSNEE